MEITYADEKVKKQCTSINEASKLFGGNKALVRSLHSRINAMSNAETIKDIVVQSAFRFHALKNKKGNYLDGYFSIDVKSITDPWRIILQPLDDNKEPFNPCNIDEIADSVRIIEISEVSKHYE